MKFRIISILSIGLLALVASQSNATVFRGSATGSFGGFVSSTPYQGNNGNPDGFWEITDRDPDGRKDPAYREDIYYINNNDSAGVAKFDWGLPYMPYQGTLYDFDNNVYDPVTGTLLPNSFVFNGEGSDGAPLPEVETTDPNANPFAFGLFDYYNGDTRYSWGIEGVTLDVQFYIENEGGTQVADFSMAFDFEIENVSNYPNGTDQPWVNTPDFVHLKDNRDYTEQFWSEGKLFELHVLGFYDYGTDLYSYDFSSPEFALSSAELRAEIYEVPVPEPATVLLFGVGLVGLVGASIRKKANI